MKFKNMQFFFDEKGQPLVEHNEKQSRMVFKPRLVTAAATRSAYFYLISEDNKRISICRRYKDLDTDPYNCDGSPASTWTMMYHHTLNIYENRIEIVGFEQGNMCWAGKYHPGYEGGGRKLLHVPECQLLTEADQWKKPGIGSDLGIDSLLKQKIVLW